MVGPRKKRREVPQRPLSRPQRLSSHAIRARCYRASPTLCYCSSTTDEIDRACTLEPNLVHLDHIKEVVLLCTFNNLLYGGIIRTMESENKPQYRIPW
jgi:hypothetical protein